METFSIGYALLATQNALLDVVTPSLRAVIVDVRKETEWLYLHFYYDGEAPERSIDLWQCAITEASAHLGPDCELDNWIDRWDYPKPIPPIGRCAYLRKELHTALPAETENAGSVTVEIKDFKEPIGDFVCPVTYQKMSTTWGAMYGTHLIPAKPADYPIEIFPSAYALLAVLKALLGKVTPELRAVFVDANQESRVLNVHCYYHGDISGQLIALWKLVVAETAAAMGSEYTLNGDIQRLDFPQLVPCRGRYAYCRFEPKQYEGAPQEWL